MNMVFLINFKSLSRPAKVTVGLAGFSAVSVSDCKQDASFPVLSLKLLLPVFKTCRFSGDQASPTCCTAGWKGCFTADGGCPVPVVPVTLPCPQPVRRH